MRYLVISIFFSLVLFSPTLAMSVDFTINPDSGKKDISPYIYGTNQDLSGTEGFAFRRLGGNRMTGYNWENNASTAGTDWNNSSDNFMTWALGVPSNLENTPGISATVFNDTSLSRNAKSLITLQCAGYVAKDKKGTVSAVETAPSARWVRVMPAKGGPLSATPDTADTAVYMDEFVNFLVAKYGPASSAAGVFAYALDNEPALWPSTHPRIHPAATGCQEIVDRNSALATAAKHIDSTALVFGPVLYGFAAYNDFQSAPDWNTVKGSHAWFIDYYLDKMRAASDIAGRRLLDVLDLHWYSEAQGDGSRIVQAANPASHGNAMARVQAPRTLWDPAYREDSWIATWYPQFLPLIPRMNQSIAAYNPGTGLAFTEYNYGGENHISGGIAMADVLGIFGKYGVTAASFWQMESKSDYVSAAFRLYRNFNGKQGGFGNVSVRAGNSDSVNASVYASLVSADDRTLHLIAMNKSFDSTLTARFNIAGTRQYVPSEVWGFDSVSAQITVKPPVSAITGNQFSYPLPPLSVFHFVLQPLQNSVQSPLPACGNYLLEASPNPFASRIAISFQLPDKRNLSLSIYNLAGRRVALLAEGTLAAGRHQVNWDARRMSSGVYIVELKSGKEKLIRKLLLAK